MTRRLSSKRAAPKASPKLRRSRTTRLPRYVGINTFDKVDIDAVAFQSDAPNKISLKAGTCIAINGVVHSFASNTPVQLPKLSPGADYAIYICSDGKLRASENFAFVEGIGLAKCRKIGGFHYAPGGNAMAQRGGDAVPAINPYSIWDLKFRPACPDPRGMALIGGSFWCDIYLCNTSPEKGTSRYNETIADGWSPPTIPKNCGGDGRAKYDSFNWWQAAEVLSAAGKQLLCYDEFAVAAFGTTEQSSADSDPDKTILRKAYTSHWGVMLATGNMWTWGRDLSHWPGETKPGWKSVTQDRGQVYLPHDYSLVSAIFGGYWNNGSNCGSRSSYWGIYPWNSSNIGARGRCDHLRLV